jgi:hypothetical protein
MITDVASFLGNRDNDRLTIMSAARLFGYSPAHRLHDQHSQRYHLKSSGILYIANKVACRCAYVAAKGCYRLFVLGVSSDL